MKTILSAIGRVSLTAVVTAGAVYAGWQMWRHYEVEPWTRDGRVKAYVVQVAPDVTGQVTKVYVHDNQQVKAGEPLFDIDRARFELALRQSEAQVTAAQAALAQALRENQRNTQLDDLVSQETREQGQTRTDQARAALAQAIVNRDTAKLNLERTRVVSSVNGIVTNLDPQEIWLFGSRGRGTARPDSDFDLLVVARPGQDWADDYARAYMATRATGIGCDVVPMSKAEFDEAASLHTSFVAVVRDEGRRIYEARP